jgi:hypothetical protein
MLSYLSPDLSFTPRAVSPARDVDIALGRVNFAPWEIGLISGCTGDTDWVLGKMPEA